MGRKCNVLDCPSDSRRTEDNGVTFHKMPFHPDLRPKWIELCKIPEERQVNKVIYVCSRHFRRTDFCNFKGTKYMLRQGALPSVFPWTKKPVKLTSGPRKITIPSESENNANSETESSSETVDSVKTASTSSASAKSATEKNAKMSTSSSAKSVKKKDVSEDDPGQSELKKDPTKKEAKKDSPVITQTPKIEEPINFVPGTRIEANDFNDKWYPASILEVDYDENEVFVEFDKHLNRANEWIPMDSSRLRAYQPRTNVEVYSVGERCLATWTDTFHKFPAVVRKVLDGDMYEVLFDDGFEKVLKHHKMSKVHERNVHHVAPLFDPVVGSKEERRERKRKLNVAELFAPQYRKKHKNEEAPITVKNDTVGEEEKPPKLEDFPSNAEELMNVGLDFLCNRLKQHK